MYVCICMCMCIVVNFSECTTDRPTTDPTMDKSSSSKSQQ